MIPPFGLAALPSVYESTLTLDKIPLGGEGEEYMLINIVPDSSLGDSIEGVFHKNAWPYRYLDQDASGENAIFEPGQYIQFLHNVRLLSTGSIAINGSNENTTLIYSRGDKSKGIYIQNGGIKLMENGQLRFY